MKLLWIEFKFGDDQFTFVLKKMTEGFFDLLFTKVQMYKTNFTLCHKL